MPLIDGPLATMAKTFEDFASPCDVTRTVDGVTASVLVFARGMSGKELLGGAMQSDRIALLRVADWEAVFGSTPPVRFDRFALRAGDYSVQDVRASPESGTSVFYKLVLRGGRV